MLIDDTQDRELLALAEETCRVAGAVHEPAIRARLRQIASELREWADAASES
jgi:hypothetical protein